MKRQNIIIIVSILALSGVGYLAYRKFGKPVSKKQQIKAEELKERVESGLSQEEGSYWDLIDAINAAPASTLPEGWTPAKDVETLHEGIYSGLFGWAEDEEKIYKVLGNKTRYQIRLIFDGFYDKTMKRAEEEILRLFNRSELNIVTDILNRAE